MGTINAFGAMHLSCCSIQEAVDKDLLSTNRQKSSHPNLNGLFVLAEVLIDLG